MADIASSKFRIKSKPPRFGARGDKLVRAILDKYPLWAAEKTGSGHIRLRSPGGAVVIVSATSNGWDVLPSTLAHMRRTLRQGKAMP
jgi:hypothetical protein